KVPRGSENGLHQAVVTVAFDQVSDHLRIGSRAEAVSLCGEGLPQILVVLDDSVMHDRQPPFAVHVGMGVGFGWASMSRPARVSDAESAARRRRSELALERGDLSDRLVQLQTGSVQRGHTR